MFEVGFSAVKQSNRQRKHLEQDSFEGHHTKRLQRHFGSTFMLKPCSNCLLKQTQVCHSWWFHHHPRWTWQLIYHTTASSLKTAGRVMLLLWSCIENKKKLSLPHYYQLWERNVSTYAEIYPRLNRKGNTPMYCNPPKTKWLF